jgi:hypothetical protein
VRRAGLESIEELFGFGVQETSCLVDSWNSAQDSEREQHALTFENVQANPAKLIDIGVIYLRQEANFWRGHGIVIGKEQFELENAACIVK